MKVHQEYDISGEWSRKLSLIVNLINVLEIIKADFECNDVIICDPTDLSELLGSTITICVDRCIDVPNELQELDRLANYGLINDYKVRVSQSMNEGISINELYRKAINYFDEVFDYLDSYLLRTYLEGLEYIVLVLTNGKALLLEGERGRVVVPAKNVIASAHTHPRGCLPSPHDIRSLINMFFEGGIGLGIKSKDCTLKIVRVGPFTEKDYVELAIFRNMLRKNDLEAIKEIIKRGIIGDNIKIVITF